MKKQQSSPLLTTNRVSVHDRLVTLPEALPELTLGWEVVKWATTYLKHPNGPRAGQRWRFVDSQVKFLLHWYAVNEDGEWLYRHGVRRLAKGSGKSPFAALIALAEFTAPVRLKDFDPAAPGGCVGKQVPMALVQLAAVSEAQTTNTMRHVRAMAPKGSRLARDFGLDPGKTIIYRPDGGALQVITSAFESAEGAEPTFLVADETEHWHASNGGIEFNQTLDRNLRKSGSRMLETCNAWEPGVASVAETSWDAFVAQEEGRTRGESSILYDARIAPPDTDLADERSLTDALRFVYGDCFWVPLNDIREAVWDPRTPPDKSRRFYLNQPTATKDAWVTQQQWSALARPDLTVEANEDIAMFFDGSKSGDATALVGCRLSDGHVFLIAAWEPGPDRELVPVAEVDATVALAFNTWNIRGFFGDVREWESFVKVSWPDAHKDELDVWAESANSKDPQPIAWDMRNHVLDFTKACELMHAEIQQGGLTHDGNPVLTRHVVNARRRTNKWGISIGKESPGSPRKIDAAVCAIGARMVRRLVLAEQAKRKPKRTRTGRVVGF